jgi:hypothetical protein
VSDAKKCVSAFKTGILHNKVTEPILFAEATVNANIYTVLIAIRLV